ncbi:MAG: Gfo/Idh/MocA family oxidoreductase, partial [Candidatus Omnitrophica bacterium]|nr:Gfo/Idh/MocA family oxidoreductase [Candidatus Omnitrophota bacterium]
MSQIGAGIVGSGWVAEEYIKAFQKDERSEVRSIYSRSKEKPEGYKKKYDLSCDIESDFETMLKRDDIDVVVIATPHDRHTEYVIPAAEAGKHLIIEKPVAL